MKCLGTSRTEATCIHNLQLTNAPQPIIYTPWLQNFVFLQIQTPTVAQVEVGWVRRVYPLSGTIQTKFACRTYTCVIEAATLG